MTDQQIFASYPVFKADLANWDETETKTAAAEVESLFDEWSDRVEVRGAYSTVGFTERADLFFWWIAKSAENAQGLLAAFRRTALGQRLAISDAFLGLVRPAEFAKDHLPAFLKGEAPKPYATVYPFVRTPEWYLLEPDIRANLLRVHGEAGREFPDVLANTTSAFGLGDYEWILAFEADGLDRLVDLIRRLRATEARLYTKLDVPFITGIRKPLVEVIANLP